MTEAPDVRLSTVVVSSEGEVRRVPPRALEDRQPGYESQFDSMTVFFDVFRSNGDIVLCGPPLMNFRQSLSVARWEIGAKALSFPDFKIYERDRECDVWISEPGEIIRLEAAFGQYDCQVQPSNSHLTSGKRVLFTVSKDNEISWIIDWVAFYHRVHGSEAVVIYDNNSKLYTREELELHLHQAFPELCVVVVAWPFVYGPSGGRKGMWDSDFCQIGAMQHARFRLLAEAKSVINADVDELVIGTGGQSVHEAAERSPFGFVDYGGIWVSAHREPADDIVVTNRFKDFSLVDRRPTMKCPRKWCIVPQACPRESSWLVHSVSGKTHAVDNFSTEFVYRHFRGISNGWKYNRTVVSDQEKLHLDRDETLVSTLSRAGIG